MLVSYKPLALASQAPRDRVTWGSRRLSLSIAGGGSPHLSDSRTAQNWSISGLGHLIGFHVYQIRGLDSLNRHFRAALQRTLQIHRDRRREYADVLHRLDEYQSHLDRRRRDLGYESPHHDG